MEDGIVEAVAEALDMAVPSMVVALDMVVLYMVVLCTVVPYMVVLYTVVPFYVVAPPYMEVDVLLSLK
jgi:hypothetical protein